MSGELTVESRRAEEAVKAAETPAADPAESGIFEAAEPAEAAAPTDAQEPEKPAEESREQSALSDNSAISTCRGRRPRRPAKKFYIGTPRAAFPTQKGAAQKASMALFSVQIYLNVKESDLYVKKAVYSKGL